MDGSRIAYWTQDTEDGRHQMVLVECVVCEVGGKCGRCEGTGMLVVDLTSQACWAPDLLKNGGE